LNGSIPPGKPDMDQKERLNKLLEGNSRFVSGNRVGVSAPWDPDAMLSGQEPFAAVLGCSDSRVPPEQLFDMGPGEIFVVRVAGNIAGKSQIESLEYAVSQLHVPLLVVLGHDDCGAIKAALKSEAAGTDGDLIWHVRLAVAHVLVGEKAFHDVLHEAVQENILSTMKDLIDRSPLIRQRMESGDLALVGARLSLDSGEVSVLKVLGKGLEE